jgi:hypothetical protein
MSLVARNSFAAVAVGGLTALFLVMAPDSWVREAHLRCPGGSETRFSDIGACSQKMTAGCSCSVPRHAWSTAYWLFMPVAFGIVGVVLFRAPIAAAVLMLAVAMAIAAGLCLAVENTMGRIGLAEIFYAVPFLAMQIGVAVLAYVLLLITLRYWRNRQ